MGHDPRLEFDFPAYCSVSEYPITSPTMATSQRPTERGGQLEKGITRALESLKVGLPPRPTAWPLPTGTENGC